MSIERKHFIDMMFQYSATTSRRLFIEGKTWTVETLRTNLVLDPKGESIVITPAISFVPYRWSRMFGDSNELFHKLLNPEAEFTLEQDVENTFDADNYGLVRWQNQRIAAEKLLDEDDIGSSSYTPTGSQYLQLLNEELAVDNTIVMRYHPLITERKQYISALNEGYTIMFACGEMTLDNVDIMIDRFSNTYVLVKEFYKLSYMSGRNRDNEKGTMQMDDFSQTVSGWSQIDFDYKKMKYWNHSKHNIFGQAVCRAMGWNIPAEFDVDVGELYDYIGPSCMKTPDMAVVNDDGSILLLDFAVTTGNCGNVRDSKLKKYEDLCVGLSAHLNKKVTCDAVVWKIQQRDNFQIPSYMNDCRDLLKKDRDLDAIFQMYLTIASYPNYEQLRTMTDDLDEDSGNFDARLAMITELNKSIISTSNITRKITDNITSSRTFIENKGAVADSEFMEDLIETSKTDVSSYEMQTALTMKNMIIKGKLPKYLKDTLKFDKKEIEDKIVSMFDEEFEKRKNFINRPTTKLPKIFKFPLLDKFANSENTFSEEFFLPFISIKTLEDGTMFSATDFPYNDDEKEYVSDGIGMDIVKDTILIEEILTLMQKPVALTYDTMMKMTCNESLEDYPVYEQVRNTKAWVWAEFIGELMENISYLDGRRHQINKRDGHTVYKDFGEYGLMIHSGSKLTAQKQIRYKVFTDKERALFQNHECFHKWTTTAMSDNIVESKWLTISITDIRHFLRIREVYLGIASDSLDKAMEINRNEEIMPNIIDKGLMTMMLIYMEHKRGTSTSIQLNRYLLHSATGYITNRMKLMSDVCSDPVRSVVESYVRITQLNWYRVAMKKSEQIWFERVSNMLSTATDYDRFYMPSFFDPMKNVEFGTLMNEIYVCNLFDKEAGFMDHRIKRIVAKMTEAEMHFKNIKDNPWSKGDVENQMEFLEAKDELHMFDKKFVVAATKKYFSKKANKLKIQEAVLKSLTSTIDGAMMLTASLVSGPLRSEALEFSERVTKSKSFLTLFDEVKKLSTNMLLHMVSQRDEVDAIFSIFPKQQIGGPREILIMSVQLRIMVKFFETMSRNLCLMHEKEMLTKDRKKAEVQSDKMNEYKEMMKTLKIKGNKPMYASLNADATRWSPGFVMEHWMHFIFNMDLPDEIKDFMMTIVSAFSSKKMLVPEILKKKWKNKPKHEAEFVESVEYFRNLSDDNRGVVDIKSGMGQGMLHFFSSFYHCVIDDFTDDITKTVLESSFNTKFDVTTLISSDDKTKLLLFNFLEAEHATPALNAYVVCTDLIYRLANIHTNWKKSALQFNITEFNSLFSIGKRMCWATIKDIYTANMIPDLTSPEQAVLFMLSNIRRCMEHGLYMSTIKILLILARDQLKRYYRYDDEVVGELCKTLECEEKDLPHQLGFIPTEMVYETLIFGPNIHMFKETNSEKLKNFYRALHSATTLEFDKLGKGTVPFSEACTGKYWFELPTKLDRKLEEIKDTFFKDRINLTPETVLTEMNKRALNVHCPLQDMKHYKTFTMEYFVGQNKRYAFQETMVVHSLIRALQLSRAKGVIYPRSLEEVEAENTLRRIRNEGGDEINNEEIAKEMVEFLTNKSVDVIGFVNNMLSRDVKMTTLDTMMGYKEIVEIHNKNNEKLAQMSANRKFTHSSMRTVRFFASDINNAAETKDILNYIFEARTDMYNSVIYSFISLMNTIDRELSIDEVLKNPFQFIKEVMKGMTYSFKAFKDFMDYNYKSMKFVKITMLHPVYCAGSLEENLLSMYRMMSNPNYILEDTSRDTKTSEEMDFLTRITMGVYNAKLDNEHASRIRLSDNKIMMTKKILDNSHRITVDTSNMTCDKVIYNARKVDGMMTKTWFNFNLYILAVEHKNVVLMYAYKNPKSEAQRSDRGVMATVERYITEMTEIGKEVIMKCSEYTIENYRITFDKKEILFSSKIVSSMLKWMAVLTISVNVTDKKIQKAVISSFNIYKDEYFLDSNTASYITLDEDETLTFDDLTMDPLPVLDLDKLLIEKNWIVPDIFVQEGNLEGEVDSKEHVRELNAFIGSSMMLSTMSNLFASIRSLPQELKEDSPTHEEFNELLPKDELQSLTKAFREAMQKTPEMEEPDIENYEKMSLVSMIDKIVFASLNTEINVHTATLKNAASRARINGTQNGFHNMLFNQIMRLYDWEISETMAVMIYNIIIKKESSTILMSPTNNLKRINIADEKKRVLNNVNTFITKKVEGENIDEDLLLYN